VSKRGYQTEQGEDLIFKTNRMANSEVSVMSVMALDGKLTLNLLA